MNGVQLWDKHCLTDRNISVDLFEDEEKMFLGLTLHITLLALFYVNVLFDPMF